MLDHARYSDSESVDRLGIDALSGLGLPPVKFVELASKLDVRNISLRFRTDAFAFSQNPPFNLETDKALRNEVGAALLNFGVKVVMGEGCVITDHEGARSLADRLFGPMLEIGIRRVHVVSITRERRRTFDELGAFVDLACSAGFEEIVTEFAPVLTLRDLPMALEALDHVDRPELRLLIDTMHLARSGATPDDLAAIQPSKIGYIQLCDAPLVSDIPYMEEAMTNRLAPGEGELPLLEMLAAMPRDLIVSLELPQLGKLEAGVAIEDILRPALETSRSYLNSLSNIPAANKDK